MVENFQPINMPGLAGAETSLKGPQVRPETADGKDFKNLLMDSIKEVNRLQAEADQASVNLVTGKTENVAEVFTAVKKAELAFQTLMQINKKLMDAYEEIRQMRV